MGKKQVIRRLDMMLGIVTGEWKWGPAYLVYRGKLISVEYEYKHVPFKGRKVTTPEGELWVYEIGRIPVGHEVNHMTIEYLPPRTPGDRVLAFCCPPV